MHILQILRFIGFVVGMIVLVTGIILEINHLPHGFDLILVGTGILISKELFTIAIKKAGINQSLNLEKTDHII